MIEILRQRFLLNPTRHPNVEWGDVERCLLDRPRVLASLSQMEQTGGEPDVIAANDDGGLVFAFADCAPETPEGRRSLCYDDEALKSRTKHPPRGSACGQATAMGVTLMNEAEYAYLQTLGEFDMRTSSWLETDVAVRGKGGALFGDRRYGRVFTYHNGADSYYSSRGWRGILRIRAN
ncbi:DUF4256 domain-containing protein [Schaalia vaccimaxillae]|uniref:DUF4256 domain-containing protein n=1 Tax=Schaalia vaccimaxillae TaxID=183916 RepID=UPI0003B32D90|nr:DUF4256 domain-containing protein [Schaalia vaccimaxillae]